MNCILCQPLAPYEISSFQHWRIVLNHNQNKLGKCMVCLKRHDEDICNLSSDELSELWDIIRQIKAMLLSWSQPDHFNYAFLMNKDAHVHLHVIPRYQSKRIFAGIEFDDDENIEQKLPGAVEHQIVTALRKGLNKE